MCTGMTNFNQPDGIKVSNIGTLGFCPEVSAKLMEVVGNIYDNPELLEA